MTRLLIECTNVFRNPRVNSGIQRVVRNIVRHLGSTADTVECIPVIFARGRLYRVTKLTPDPADEALLARAYELLERLNGAFWRAHGRYENHWPMTRVHNLRRAFYVVSRVLNLPIALGLRSLRLLGFDPLLLRAEPFEAHAGDQLVLLDSSWHEAHFGQIEQLKRQGVGIVAVLYDLIPLTRPEFFDTRLSAVFSAWFDWVIHTADGYMAISRSVRDQLKHELATRLGTVAAEKPWYGYFHLGSELDLIRAELAPPAELTRLFNAEQPVYLAVSTVEPRKNHSYLLDAFELLWAQQSPVRLCIIGRVGWKCEALIKRIEGHPEFGRRLFMFNQLDDGGLEYAYARAKALVFSSHDEGFGLPLVEAMQRGLPAMGSDIPVFHEVGGEYMAYFDLQAPQTLADLVTRFEQSGEFPAAGQLTDWQWIGWGGACRQLVDGIMAEVGPQEAPQRQEYTHAGRP
ncbi:glycosyltransferase family 4 protein [Pseudomonas leptonychotis]|uniref:Glycosyltransferase family 1 protein n=1 Tax=Pseudomonas leptonychotis TaxID=2448482 RepID=A0A4T2A2T1_9PSED|nr:glycosyltransferase family 1 protein [Pseudomonas leptonychotis]TIH10592.1 glycosyltransferase family 1 protein [Pseudomonas leptonychotis]